MRLAVITAAVAGLLLGAAAPAGACAGLVTPGGTVRLERTATLAAYADGVEHYITSFQFSGGGAEFGSILPLPGIPTKVEKGGEWTLQRLALEVNPPPPAPASDGPQPALAPGPRVVYETRIDALDITILEGGATAVGRWAKEHGFRLTPDAPAVLAYYAARSRIFMAARFNAQAARERGQQVGDGTPIHLTIPTRNPWVPLRILSLGLPKTDQVTADVFLLTTRRPILMPVGRPGVVVERREPASTSLLDDLRSDKGMGWVPRSMWLTHLTVNTEARNLRFDLAADVSGRGRPSAYWAGLWRPAPPRPVTPPAPSPAPEPADVASPAPEPAVVPQAAPEPVPGEPVWPAPLAALLVLATGGRLLADLRRRRAAR